MRRLLKLVIASIAALGLVGLAQAPAGALPSTPSEAEQSFLQLLNSQRAGAGLGFLVLDSAASNVARPWSEHMRAVNTLSHNPNYVNQIQSTVTPDWTRLGENVGVGYDVSDLHRAFFNSPGHRANMLGDYNRVGIGVALDGNRLWVTFDFVKGPAIGGATGLNECSTPGYLLDGFGGLHPVGSAPYLATSAYWNGWDIAQDFSLAGNRAGGYVLDGYGGLHPVGQASNLAGAAYWPGWRIARAVATNPDGKGAFVLDGWGGIHNAGTAATVTPSGYWSGWDIARDIQVDPTTGNRGYVLDGFGGLHPFGGMPAVHSTGYWSGWDIARTFTFNTDGKGGYVTDGYGGMHPFAVGNNPMPAAISIPVGSVTPNVRGALVEGGTPAVITGTGAELGANSACGRMAAWGSWDIVRAVDR